MVFLLAGSPISAEDFRICLRVGFLVTSLTKATTEGRMTAAKYREILEENLLQSAATSDRGDGSPFSTTMT
ncbi:hypothetical protein LDENG_00012930 [Lucifuga dentata]|nr:hypothetical protein LDENG_00012930 [Lucifuga dentata]